MRWADFEKRQPTLADLGRGLLGTPGVVLVGTIRRDGAPRLSPVEPLFWDGDLWLSMGLGTRKALDLFRDHRILVHNVVTSRQGENGEYKVRGYVVPHDQPRRLIGYAAQMKALAGWQPEPGQFHLFAVEVEDVTFIRWNSATNDQFVTRWPEFNEFVRRGTSATSLGRPEAYRSPFLSDS